MNETGTAEAKLRFGRKVLALGVDPNVRKEEKLRLMS